MIDGEHAGLRQWSVWNDQNNRSKFRACPPNLKCILRNVGEVEPRGARRLHGGVCEVSIRAVSAEVAGGTGLASRIGAATNAPRQFLAMCLVH